MNRKYKTYLKLNIMSLFFIAISCISVTLAWFAYSGIAKVATEIDVKSWLIEFEKGESTVSNNIVISLAEIYPGMDTLYESIKIKNRGDSDAKLSVSIVSARILEEEFDIENTELNSMLDELSTSVSVISENVNSNTITEDVTVENNTKYNGRNNFNNSK